MPNFDRMPLFTRTDIEVSEAIQGARIIPDKNLIPYLEGKKKFQFLGS